MKHFKMWKFTGHTLREEDGMERPVIRMELTRKRVKGRKKTKMIDWMKETMREGADLGRTVTD